MHCEICKIELNSFNKCREGGIWYEGSLIYICKKEECWEKFYKLLRKWSNAKEKN